MKIKVWVIGLAIVFSLVLLSVLGKACWWANEAVNVVAEEVSPRELLRKYTWFKDASAVLDKKLADIQVYQTRVGAVQHDSTATRADKEQMYVWMSEVAGVKASYNQLAAEYNAQMAKINWRFTNVGDLPAGATTPLPREYKPYINN